MTDSKSKRRNTNSTVHKEHLRAGIRGLSKRLEASLGGSSPLGDSLTKGELREEDVVTAFRPHVAGRYDLVKGVVVNADGRESDPQDVVLLDTFVLPSFLGAGNTRLVPVEGVVGVIQIKSVATPSSIRSAVNNIATAKRLLTAEPRYGFSLVGSAKPQLQSTGATFFGGVLFLSKRGKDEALKNAYVDAVARLDKRERCDVLCISDRFSVLWGDPSNGPGIHFCFRGEQAEAPLLLDAGPDSLLFFYLTLAEHLANWVSPPTRWMSYVFGTTSLKLPYSYAYNSEEPPAWVATHTRPDSANDTQ